MEWTWMDYERVKKNEYEISLLIEKLGKRYKYPAVFGKTCIYPDNGDRYAAAHYEGEWGKNSYCLTYLKEKNELEDNYYKHDLIVITEIVPNSTKNEIKYKMTTTLDFKLEIFKPVLYIQYCIKSNKYVSTSSDFSIMINPLPKVWERLNMTKEERKDLAKKTYAKFEA